jgi:hypothetical protein
MSAYGCYVKFTTQSGQHDALVEHLLSAAAEVSKHVLPLLAGPPKRSTSCQLAEMV